MKDLFTKVRYIFDKKQKLNIIALLVLIIIGSCFELIGVAIFMPFISLIMDFDATLNSYSIIGYAHSFFGDISKKRFIVILAVVICVIYVVKNVYLLFMQNCIMKFSYSNRKALSIKLLKTYMYEPYTFHLNRNISILQRSLQSDTHQFMQLISASINLLAEVVVMIALGGFLFHTSHSITIMIMGMLIVFIGIYFFVSKNISVKLGRLNEYYNAKLIQAINQAISGIKEVKVLRRENYFIDSYEKLYAKEIIGAKKNEMLSAMPKYIIETISIVGMLSAIILKILFGSNDDLQAFIPQLSAFAIAAFRILPSVGKINSYINAINYNKPSLDFVYEDLSSIDNSQVIINNTEDSLSNLKFEKAIHLKNVGYRYPDGVEDVIKDVTIDIKKGQSVAFIGSSGAGKTTLADIVLGLLKPSRGVVRVDDWDINENPNSWHKYLGYIPQVIYLIDDTIKNNIAFGIPEDEIDEDAVNRAVDMAQLREYVDSLPDGLNSMVGDRGVRISGGQRQRIGIARALYHNPEILILDEATSALDNETEKAVMESINYLKGEKTLIIIAHRLTTIKNVDVIYEILDGNACRRTKEEIGLE